MEIQVLGDLQVMQEGKQVYVSSARKPRLLLACLLSRPGQTCSIDWLVSALWGDDAPASARRNVQQYVHQLRVWLGESWLPSRPGGYTLAVGTELDAEQFRSLTADGSAALEAGEAEQAASLLREALDLWHGPAFGEFTDCEPVAVIAAQLDQLRLAALERWAKAELLLNRPEKLVAELPAMVRANPFQESLRAQLMLALYRSGRQAEALVLFQEGRDLLRETLGVDPGDELSRVHTAILRGSGEPPAPQTTATVVVRPAELPADVADFTGRELEVKQLDELAGCDSALVVTTISGTGGVGKTALAVHWAHQVAQRFSDGQLYVNLHGYDSGQAAEPAGVLGRFLQSLGVPSDQIPAQESHAAAMYRSIMATRRMLVVLDNARSADQVRPLLPGSKGCLVLVTSRDQLGGLIARDGARRVSLEVLTATEAVCLLERILGAQRCGGEPGAVTELASACGYLPLALRVAAANLSGQPQQSIAGYLAALRHGNRLSALAVDDDESSAVRLVIGHSYAALDPAAQRLFRLLSLAPGVDFSAQTAAAVADVSVEQATALLGVLAEASLADERTAGRFSFHDLLREHGRELAAQDPEEAEAAQVRLLECYTWATHSADRLLRPNERPNYPAEQDRSLSFPDRTAALTWLEAEADNLVAAVQYFALTHPRAAWQIAGGLYSWQVRSHHRESWVAVYALAAAAAAKAGDANGEALMTGRLGVAAALAADYPKAIAACERAHELRLALGDRHGATTALVNLAATYVNAGQPDAAIEQLGKAEELRKDLPNMAHLGLVIQVNLAEAHQIAGRHAESLHHHQTALAVAESVGKERDVAQIRVNLGNLLLDMGEHEQAREQFERGRAIAHADRDAGFAAEASEGLGRAYVALGDVPTASQYLREALAGYEEMGHRNLGRVRELMETL